MGESLKPGTQKSTSEGKNSIPAISLPRGGGAIRGIGEKFAANPVTGTGSFSVPIYTSPGRSGFGPQLSLSYDSGSGNSPFGFGWNLPIPSITRKTDKGLPQYNDTAESDVYILSGAEDLVPVLQADGTRFKDDTTARGYVIHRYRPRIEGLFARIERWTNQTTGEIHWRSISRDNITTLYGKDNNSRIFDPADPHLAYPTRIFSWLICQSYDDKGNAIVYEYQNEDSHRVFEDQQGQYVALSHEHNRNHVTRSANRYLKIIKYGNRTPNRNTLTWQATDPIQLPTDTWMFEVVFDYEEGRYTEETPDAQGQVFARAQIDPPAGSSWPVRQDPFSNYRAGFEVRTYRLCRRVLMFHHFPQELGINDCLVRSTEFSFSESPIASFITSITQSGYVLQPITGQPNRYLKKTLPLLEFEYSKADIQDDIRELDPLSLENLPVGLDGAVWRWVDLDGEAVSGILTEQADAWFYKPNLGKGCFGPQQRVAAKPSLVGLSNGGGQLLDLAGDGQLDLVTFASPTPGFYERTHDQDWEQFRTFARLPNIRWDEPNLRFVDLTGDGHADVLITEQDAFTWHLSLAETGFDQAERVQQALDEETGPRLVFADGTSSIYLADFSGDGLVDLARVRNGEVCYWPNLGYGHFSAKVTMDNAPWFENIDQFSQERLRLADVDGSGTNDIIYLGRDEVLLYFNQSGNRWSEPSRLEQFPHVDSLTSVMTVDLLGNGTACLVWSSPLPGDSGQPLRYITLMDKKPHLLVGVKNNLGAETRVHYAPSTNFYLKDKQDGKPWVTRLPFPVHVVERVETYDHISGNRFVTRYAYHHGCFDGVEREFRGFGMVEQWDTEEFAALTGDGTLPEASNLDAASHVPPVRTRTWFHTGIYLGRDRVSHFYAGLVDEHDQGEYFREPAWRDDDPEARKHLLPDTVLPPNLTLEEEREACRALKGAMLRQEIYGQDGSDNADIPYLVTEQNFTVQRLQPRGENRHAVFLTHARETLSYHYERDQDDPRISHALTLEVDRYGNVLRQVAIGYGRGAPSSDPLLTDEDKLKQTRPLITYTQNRFTNPIDDPDRHPHAYHTPLPAETRTYHLTGFNLENDAVRFSFDEVTHNDFVWFESANEIAYEQKANHTVEQKRLIEHVRTLYRQNDLSALLPLGEVEILTRPLDEEVEPLALPGESYKLAFTPGLLRQVFKRNGRSLLLDRTAVLGGQGPDQGGYLNSKTLKDKHLFPPGSTHAFWTKSDEDGHWWIPSGRVLFSPTTSDRPAAELTFARNHFFLPHRFCDPFDNETNLAYDSDPVDPDKNHNLLLVEMLDSLGNVVTVKTTDDVGNTKIRNDYRVLQPFWITDPNGNRSQVVFDALGLVVATAVMGKPGENIGDIIEDTFDPDLKLAQTQKFIKEPSGEVQALLKTATTRIIYDLDRYQRCEQSPFAAMLTRETHFRDPGGSLTKIQVGFSYSDGFGRVIQQKVQAEAGHAPQRQDSVDLASGDIRPGDLLRDAHGALKQADMPQRWVGTGRTVFNNKGKPVRQYEPFFSATHLYELDGDMTDTGVSPVLCYDPLERVVATLHPNHTYEKVAIDPWQQKTWDVNDSLHPTQRYDPRDPGALPPHTVNPADDPYIGDYFRRLDLVEYLPTWYDLRMDAAKAMERWPDVDPSTGAARPENAAIRAVERSVAEKAVRHAATPSVVHSDTLGRVFLTFADNGLVGDGMSQQYATRVELDIEGNQLAVRDSVKEARNFLGMPVTDELGRIVMCYDYDMLGNPIHQASMEAGERWMLNDVTGKPIRSWDHRGHLFKTTYDELRRPIRQVVRGTDTNQSDPRTFNRDIQVEKTEYGEGQTNDALLNLRTQVFKVYDNAGVVTNASYDFKGNLLQASRTLAEDHKKLYNWGADTVQSSWETFSSSSTYDALDRPLSATSPDGSVYRPTFNEANLLETVEVNLRGVKDSNGDRVWTPFATNIDYDAKGQRTLIDYGNGVRTTYEYDKWTFRLARMRTIRGTKDTSDCTPVFDPRSCEDPPEICSRLHTNACILQDLAYTYDPAGNITHIQDSAQQIIYFRNRRVEPSTEYTYDAIYRLIEASGREHLGHPPSYSDAPRVGLLHPDDGNAMGRYLERYLYDEVGNFKEMSHIGSDPAYSSWTRSYAYEEASLIEGRKKSNRLSSTTIGSGTPENYAFDAHGNMTRMNHLPLMMWDYHDQLQSTSQQVINNGGTPEITYYVYDASGQRVRKVTERQAPAGESPTRKAERIYLGGFEIYREYGNNGNTVLLERETLHIMDDKQRISLVETQMIGDGNRVNAPVSLQRYQLGNHLGSVSLELDYGAQIISYEEYYPFGSSSYQAGRSAAEVSTKCYRYSGKERDEESGLYYYGARYYGSWLGRWCSTDPAGLVDSLNLYLFVRGSPMVLVDYVGNQGVTPEQLDDMRRKSERRAEVQREIRAKNYFASQGEARKAKRQAEYELMALDDLGFLDSLDPFNLIREVSAKIQLSRAKRDLTPVEWRTSDITYAPVVTAIAEQVTMGAATGVMGGAPAGRAITKFTEKGSRQVARTATRKIAKESGETLGDALPSVARVATRQTTERIVTAAEVLIGTSRSQFARDAARMIAETPEHPLRFLLKEGRARLKTTFRKKHHEMIENPDWLEMGHVVSHKSGEAERIVLQSGWINQFDRITVEGISGAGAYVENVVVSIGGIGVEYRTAVDWVKKGLLGKEFLENAPRVVF